METKLDWRTEEPNTLLKHLFQTWREQGEPIIVDITYRICGICGDRVKNTDMNNCCKLCEHSKRRIRQHLR